MSVQARAEGAFEGLRVVDVSTNRVGAQVSQVFADFGADVLMVEPPGGSPLRSSAAFPFWARGKSSLVLDLQTPGDRERLLHEVDRADILIETFRPGHADRVGLGAADLAARNPRLIHVSITGFGTTGPYAGVRGYEGVVAAKLGVFQEFSAMRPGEEPRFTTVPWCSFSASQAALQGALAAIVERESSGLGQRVETSLALAFGALDTWAWFEYLIEKKWPDAYRRAPTYDADGIPLSPFPYFLLIALTKDGHWLQFAQVAPHLFAAIMKALGLADMFTDPAWAGLPMFPDQERRRALWERMLDGVRQKTLAEWEAIFEADPDVFAEQFRSGSGSLDHPQLVHDGMVVDLSDPAVGAVRQPGPIAYLATTPAVVGRPAPGLGAHGDPPRSAIPIAGSAAPAVLSPGSAAPAVPVPGAGPLAGITVVELSQLFAAPFGATLLADLGARVIKVEPLTGDPIRSIIPFPESGGAKVMQGKESICLDLRTPEGMEILRSFIRSADVLLLGYRAGVAERLGLDAAAVRALNPDLVRIEAPGYGLGPPNGHRPAYAPSIGAAVGVGLTNLGATLQNSPDMTLADIQSQSRQLAGATTAASAQSDGFAALGVATAMLIGLAARALGAGGQDVLTTMINTNAHAMSAQSVTYAGARPEPGPDGDLQGLSATYRMHRASSGWVFLAAPTDREWDALVAVVIADGGPDLATDPRFATAADRHTHDSALATALGAVFARRSAAEWESTLLAADVAGVEVATAGTAATYQSEEIGRASGYLVDVEHPTFGEHPRLAPIATLSRTPTDVGPGVLAGQHTDHLLGELGFDPASVADLRARKVVG